MFHWTLDYVLQMSAQNFFVMMRHGRELTAKQRYDFLYNLCYVSAIPSLTQKSQIEIRDMFKAHSMTDEDRIFGEQVRRQAEADALESKKYYGTLLDAGSPEARDAMFAIFREHKKGLMNGRH